MTIGKLVRPFAVFSLIGLTAPIAAHAGVVIEFSGAKTASIDANFTAGWTFEVISAIQVTALDAAVVGGTGHEVRLYDSLGTLRASATPTDASPEVGSPTLFYSAAISPVILEPGVYTIAEDLPRKTDFYYDARPTVDLAGVRVTGNVFGLGLGGDPKINIGLLTNYGPDFEAVSVSAPLSAVPEPSSIALAGLMAAGVLARYYHAKRKAVAV